MLLIALSLSSFVCCDTAPPELYPLSLHDALPISDLLTRHGAALAGRGIDFEVELARRTRTTTATGLRGIGDRARSEEHTSELQSRGHLVCRLLLEKKKSEYRHERAPE